MRNTVGLILVLAALLGLLSAASAGVIYSQAKHHMLTQNYYWYLNGGSYDTFASQIVAHNFGPCHDGMVKEISVGGGFGIFGGGTPDNLILEIWEPIAPGRYPWILLAQWVVPTDQLIYETDAEGAPLLTADVSAEQLEVLHTYDYGFAAYSDADSSAPFDWTMDMANGNASFWISNDNTITWAGPYWFGDPVEDHPVANFSFEIRGQILSCDPEVIFDQTRHYLTGGNVYSIQGGCYDTFDSQIVAHAFTPCCSGLVDTIITGGWVDEGVELDNLIFEIWEPIKPQRYPWILMGQWIIPYANLGDAEDVDGVPVKVADISDAPIDLDNTVSYEIAIYSDGDYTQPWNWYCDMTSSETFDFWLSFDNTITWAGTYWFGAPENGAATAAWEFALKGKTGEVELETTPPVGVWGRYDEANADKPFFNPGWNWFSVPCPPEYESDPAGWNGFSFDILENSLYRWENRTVELYPDDFRTVDAYRGYVLRLEIGEEADEVSYEGRCPCCDVVEIKLLPGWDWFGVPKDVKQEDLKVRNDQTGEVRTVADDDAMGVDAWLNYNWLFWDSGAQTARLLYYKGGADDTVLRKWFGYRTLVTTLDVGESLTLLVPKG